MSLLRRLGIARPRSLASAPQFLTVDYAPDFYVSPAGSDTNPGTTRDKPFKTMSKALAATAAGATVCFLDGTYTLSSTLGMTKDGSASQPICWYAENIGKVVVRGAQFKWAGDYARCDGFTFDSGGASLEQVYFTACQRSELLNFVCRNSKGKAGVFSSGLSECILAGGQFWRLGDDPTQDHGWYHSGGSVWGVDLLAVGCAAWGFQFYPNSMDVVLAHATAYDNRNGAFVLNQSGGGGVIANSIFHRGPNGDNLADSQYRDITGRWTLMNSVMYANNGPGPRWSTGAPIQQSIITTSPLFNNPSADDFSLQDGSPAIGLAHGSYLPAHAPRNQAGYLGLVWGRSVPPPTDPTPTPTLETRVQKLEDVARSKGWAL